MPTIHISNLDTGPVAFSEGNGSVLQIVQREFLDWMHACGGKGRCTTCKMVVLEGAQNLSRISPAEKKYREEGRLAEDERLACQCRPLGDITIKVPEEGKLPHLSYTD